MSALRDYRKNRQMTLRQLSGEMGITLYTLFRLEKGVGYNTTKKVLSWCLEKNVDPTDIFPADTSA